MIDAYYTLQCSSVQHPPFGLSDKNVYRSLCLKISYSRVETVTQKAPGQNFCLVCKKLVSLTPLPQKPGASNVHLGFSDACFSPQTHPSEYAVIKTQERWPLNTQKAFRLCSNSSPEGINWDSSSQCSTSARSPVPSHCFSAADLGVWSLVEWLKAETVWSPSCYLMLFFLS